MHGVYIIHDEVYTVGSLTRSTQIHPRGRFAQRMGLAQCIREILRHPLSEPAYTAVLVSHYL
jgi:hypothetical protein